MLDTIYVQGYQFRDSPTAFIDTVLYSPSLSQLLRPRMRPTDMQPNFYYGNRRRLCGCVGPTTLAGGCRRTARACRATTPTSGQLRFPSHDTP